MTQPTNRNFLGSNGFVFQIEKLPNTEFFVQEANLPGVTKGVAEEGSSFETIPWQGDHVQWEDLIVTFKVDEDMKAYKEIHQWIIGMTFPRSYTEYSDLKQGITPTPRKERTKFPIPKPRLGFIESDATLFILTSKSNSNIEVHFRDSYPVSLSSIEFTTKNTDLEYFSATATFKYLDYTIK